MRWTSSNPDRVRTLHIGRDAFAHVCSATQRVPVYQGGRFQREDFLDAVDGAAMDNGDLGYVGLYAPSGEEGAVCGRNQRVLVQLKNGATKVLFDVDPRLCPYACAQAQQRRADQ